MLMKVAPGILKEQNRAICYADHLPDDHVKGQKMSKYQISALMSATFKSKRVS